ncbi:MAG: DUF4158 domain-containing protein [Aggregatilineales bacterium]
MPKRRLWLTPAQRALYSCIPDDLSDRDIARHYTLEQSDLNAIRTVRNNRNRIGFAVQLCLLRFPGLPLNHITAIPERVIVYIRRPGQNGG